jgi:hypothetical protein
MWGEVRSSLGRLDNTIIRNHTYTCHRKNSLDAHRHLFSESSSEHNQTRRDYSRDAGVQRLVEDES